VAAYLAAVPMLAGLLWSARRPDSRAGAAVILIGISGWLVVLEYLGAPEVRTAGRLAQPVLLAVLLYTILASPGRRLRSIRWRWAGAYAIGLTILVLALPGAAIGATLGMGCWWSWRVHRAGRIVRRELIFIGPITFVLLAALFMGWRTVLIAALILFPLAYLATLLHAEISAARALSGLLDELSVEPSLASWQRTVGQALGDPSLRLMSWDPDAGRFRDSGATTAPAEGAITQWVPVQRGGDLVAVMSVDQRAAAEPEVLWAAGLATGLAVDYKRLEGELRKSLARLAAAADGERRRMARDLHDCAQQRLLTLRIHLSLAGESLDRPVERQMLEDLGRELDEALAELREVSHGFYPGVLSRYGVAAALRSASSRAALDVRVEDQGLKRHAEAIEHTVYFCCLEALQNAAKHAGQGASVVVRLVERPEELRFEVHDDGVGFVPDAGGGGSGLLNLADRLKAVGGSLQVESAPGRGARVSGRIALS
jgi:signal transduction histidine kinase